MHSYQTNSMSNSNTTPTVQVPNSSSASINTEKTSSPLQTPVTVASSNHTATTSNSPTTSSAPTTHNSPAAPSTSMPSTSVPTNVGGDQTSEAAKTEVVKENKVITAV